METQNEVLDNINVEKNSFENQPVISVNKFILLSVLSFGLYEVWWIYKAWRFYKEREKLDIMPAARAIFSIFYLYALFSKILGHAKAKGYEDNYSSGSLFVGFIIFNLLSRLPDPFWLVSLFSFVFLIPPFKALNYEKQNSTDLAVVEQTSFSGRQIAVIAIGGSLWILVIMGLTANQTVY